MAPSRRIGHLATLAVLLTAVSSQPAVVARTRTTTSPSTSSIPATASSTPFSSSATTTAPALFTTAVVPVYLLDIAESLVTQYFPSSTPLDLAEVSWPSTVVIGTATYGLDNGRATSTTSQQSASHTSSGNQKGKSDANSDQASDERLAIILGSVLGAIAIAVMVLVFCCLRRRKEKSGSFFMRRSTPSTSSRGSRMANVFGGHTSYIPNGTMGSTADRDTAPLNAAGALHPGYMQHRSSRTDSDDNPFYTPQERPTSHFGHQILDGRHVEPMAIRERGNSNSALDADRPPTPFMPGLMRKPVASHQQSQNPFSSPRDDEEEEAEDVVSPILPSKSFERMRAPMVHYPSMSEVSDFDFAGSGGTHPSATDFGGGWHSARERRDGRHELA